MAIEQQRSRLGFSDPDRSSIDFLRSAKGYLAILRSLLQYTPSGRGYYSALIDAIAAQKLDHNARAAPRGLHKTTGPLPRRNQLTKKAMGPAGAPHNDKPAARLLGGRRRLDGHGQDG